MHSPTAWDFSIKYTCSGVCPNEYSGMHTILHYIAECFGGVFSLRHPFFFSQSRWLHLAGICVKLPYAVSDYWCIYPRLCQTPVHGPDLVFWKCIPSAAWSFPYHNIASYLANWSHKGLAASHFHLEIGTKAAGAIGSRKTTLLDFVRRLAWKKRSCGAEQKALYHVGRHFLNTAVPQFADHWFIMTPKSSPALLRFLKLPEIAPWLLL